MPPNPHDPVVIENKSLEPTQFWETFQKYDGVVREINAIELILHTKHSDFNS